MDLTQQVKNYKASIKQSKAQQVVPGERSKDPSSHHAALQQLSNAASGRGTLPAYAETLLVAKHEGSRAPRGAGPVTTRKAPGFCRNESGGMFTS